ncbi:MAG: hypothetical protein ACP5ON_01840 [Bacteroidota bacterium]
MRVTYLLSASLVFSSCMHLGTPMMHGDISHQSKNQPALEKEVVVGNVKAVATFPPIVAGKQAILTLRVFDAATGEPISGAQVWFHDEYLHKSETKMMHDDVIMRNESDTGHGAVEHDINFQSVVKETSTPGEYSYAYTTSQPGVHKLMFHVTPAGVGELEQELVIEAVRTVHSYEESHHGIFGWAGQTTTYIIVGTVIMGAMMILVLLTGIHI